MSFATVGKMLNPQQKEGFQPSPPILLRELTLKKFNQVSTRILGKGENGIGKI
jgi:hypothetical protein